MRCVDCGFWEHGKCMMGEDRCPYGNVQSLRSKLRKKNGKQKTKIDAGKNKRSGEKDSEHKNHLVAGRSDFWDGTDCFVG